MAAELSAQGNMPPVYDPPPMDIDVGNFVFFPSAEIWNEPE
jgi:hypothetical protein